MATKKQPSTAVKLKQAQAEIQRLSEEVKKITQERDNTKYWEKHYNEKMKDAETELEQVHSLLDVFDGVLPREKAGEYSPTKFSAMTRLASWLANRK